MAPNHQTFVGLVALRVVFACTGLLVAIFGVVVSLTAESDGTASDIAGAVTLAILCVVAGLAALAMALERLVVDDAGIHRRNPLWLDRLTPWSEVMSVRVATDQFNAHPLIETVDGRTVRLRAASGILDSPRSTPQRAAEAIRSRLNG